MNERPFSDLPDGLVDHASDRASMEAFFEHARGGFTTREQEAIRLLLEYLVGAAKPTRRTTKAAGLRLLTLFWVMHPDRIPGSNGKPVSIRDLAATAGVHHSALTRITEQIRKDFGLVNRSQIQRLRSRRKTVLRKGKA